MDLFVKTIGKKIIYLGCSISIIGLLFGFLGLKGAGQMLLIGVAGTLISSLFAGVTILINDSNMKFLQGPLTRALPIGLLSASWLYAHWSLIGNQVV